MIIHFYTPQGMQTLNTLTATDSELSALGLSRQWLTDNYGHIARAKELLASSPDVITQPEMWELMRIFGRILGITG